MIVRDDQRAVHPTPHQRKRHPTSGTSRTPRPSPPRATRTPCPAYYALLAPPARRADPVPHTPLAGHLTQIDTSSKRSCYLHWFHHHRPSVAGDAPGTFPGTDHSPEKHILDLARRVLGEWLADGAHALLPSRPSTSGQTKIADPTPEVSVLWGNLTRRLHRLFRHDPSEIGLTDLAQCGGGQLLHRNRVDMLQRC